MIEKELVIIMNSLSGVLLIKEKIYAVSFTTKGASSDLNDLFLRG